jgi:hypothetical protein
VPHLLQDWEKTLSNVKPGFTVFADLTQCKPAGPLVLPLFEHVHKLLMTAGLKKSAELLGESAIVAMGEESGQTFGHPQTNVYGSWRSRSLAR